jgi:crossover junction endodeoxyribonuclease RusA
MITLHVIGTPGAQGSKRHVGRGIMIEQNKAVGPWREAVKAAVMLAYPISQRGGDPILIHGPVVCRMYFTFHRPKSRRKDVYHTSPPDADKIARSTCDALTDMSVWEDDSRVAILHVEKYYVGGIVGMSVPGCVIEVDCA